MIVALSGNGIAPARSGCVLAHEEIAGRQAFWQLTQTALDAGACTVLLNLCHWGHLNIGGLQQVLLDWDRCPEKAGASPMVFPLTWPQLSFALQEYELAGQAIAIDIEFLDPRNRPMYASVSTRPSAIGSRRPTAAAMPMSTFRCRAARWSSPRRSP